MKKRILSMLMVIALVMGMIPGAALTAFATDDIPTTVNVTLVLKPVDTEGNPIDHRLGALDVNLNGQGWVDSIAAEGELFTVNIGENTLTNWDYCPAGYVKPDFDITFTADADGNITIISGNAELEPDDEINYIVVVLEDNACEHSYVNGGYYMGDDYHYLCCDNCNYYDLSSEELHSDDTENPDHHCDVCGKYMKWRCKDDDSNHHCVVCGEYMDWLCQDDDGDHGCDVCERYMEWLCKDENSDHFCDTVACQFKISTCQDEDNDDRCDVCDKELRAAWHDADDDGVIDEDETVYSLLGKAFDDPNATNIKLLGDVIDFSYAIEDRTLTLDLNGYTITLSGWFDTGAGANLTIKDSSSSGTGRIVCDVAADDYLDVYSGGTLTLESGTVDAMRLNNSESAVTLNGGVVSTMKVSNGMLTLGDAATVTAWEITGGTFNVDPTTLNGFDSDTYEATDNGDGTWTVQEKNDDDDPVDPIEPTETVDVTLVLKPVDTEGNSIDIGLGAVDVELNGYGWVDSIYAGEYDLYAVNVGENTLTNWDLCPEGYSKPNFDITFTADADGNITITSGNATLEKEGNVYYIVVELAESDNVVDPVDPIDPTDCEHTYENGRYTFDDDYHYPLCDNCDYYDPSSAEAHFETAIETDHCCDVCRKYVRDWCIPEDPETNHYCFNGENCGKRLKDLCTDADDDHVCDGCEELMDWFCYDGDNDHLCDTERCRVRIDECYDGEDEDSLCDTCGAVLATVSTEFTELNYTYDRENDEILVSGTLEVYADWDGTITVEWYDEDAPITVTGRVTEGVATVLAFEEVDFGELSYVTIIFVPDNEEVNTLEDFIYLGYDTPQVSVSADSERQESIGGIYTIKTWINDLETSYLYLFPGTEVTVKLNVQPGDSYSVTEFYYLDSDSEEQAVDYFDDGKGTLTFTMPEVDRETVYITAIFEHDTADCIDADKDHWCDSDLCETFFESVDANGDNLCDICGVGMAQLGSQKSCMVETLLNPAADGDTVKLLADHAMAGDASWTWAMWFSPDDDITVTLDLNGFTFSVLESDYLIGVGNGTLRIIDSSEAKTGALKNENGESIFGLDGGALDLSDYLNPEGLTIYNYGTVVGVSGHLGEEPIKVMLPEGYTVEHEEYGMISMIPGESTVTVVKIHAEIKGATVTSGSDLALNYYVSMSDDYKDAVMYFTMSNGKTAEVTGVYDEESGMYVFTFDKLPPQTMGDTIDAVLKLDDVVLEKMKGYSIKAYAEYVLNNTLYENNTELLQLVSDILHYGAAAQQYTGYKTDEPVNVGVDNIKSASSATPEQTDKTINQSVSQTVGFTSVGVCFDYNNRIYVKLSTTENVKLVVNGEEVTLDGTTYMTDGILATEFGKVFTFELYEGETLVQTLTYSVRSYVLDMQNSQNEKMTALANALYAYGKSAEAYMATQKA